MILVDASTVDVNELLDVTKTHPALAVARTGDQLSTIEGWAATERLPCRSATILSRSESQQAGPVRVG
ncbi:MAG: hypothetical protein ABI704_00610 [Kofleriaceae bacterium]